MKRTNRLVLLIGVFLAALAFVLVIVLLNGQTGTNPNASPPPAKVATVVAARDIALGVTITQDMLTTQQLDPGSRSGGAFSNAGQVIGSVTRASVKSGQQLTASTFIEQSGANLEVPAGLTAIAVQVDQVSGVGTLIKTGDYVDLVAGISTGDQKFPVVLPAGSVCANATAASKVEDACYDHTSVKLLIQGVQVLTTLLPPPPTAQTGAATPAPSSGGTSLNGQQEIVILAVTPQQVEVIKFAQLDGNISLVLRSPKDFVDANGALIVPTAVKTTGIILKTLVTNWGVLPPQTVYTVDSKP